MGKLVALQFFGTHFLIIISLALIAHSAPITSCSQAPYPDVCNHYMGTPNFVSKTLDQTNDLTFRDLALKVTLDQAIETHRFVSNMNLGSFNERTRLASSDCLELYLDTIDQLNRSMTSTNYLPLDTQTRLSAAITNQETCLNGFIDFNLTSYLQYLPSGTHNLSKLLSNSLAINKAEADEFSAQLTKFSKQGGSRRLLSSDERFPTWVLASDRKLLEDSDTAPKADLVVAKDGSGDYKTVSEAVGAAAKLRKGNKRFVIHVKAGVYKENVEIKKSTKNLMIVGDGIDSTIVTASKNVQDGSTTFRSATFAASGERFMARDITFENTAGPAKHQAVALRSASDFSVFYRCSFKGYQDTLYVYSHRQFYRNCDIYGTVDFIFGDAVAVLQKCNIYVRRPMAHQKNTVTAQGRKDPNENTGIVIHSSKVTAAGDLTETARVSMKTYLGRPWKEYSRTVFVKCVLDGLIDPAGWLEWSGDFALSTLYYGEYMNSGNGASTSRRVKWQGFHVIKSVTEAGKFTVGNFMAGDSWIPATGVPFDSGL